MSASQDKRRRQSEREGGLDKRSLAEREAAAKAKKEKRKWIAVGTISFVLIALILLVNSPLLYTVAKSVNVAGESYTNAEYQYFYYSAYNNFYSRYANYMSMFFDTTKPLDEQSCSVPTLQMLGQSVPDSVAEMEDPTWADYFKAVALENMRFITVLSNEAKAKGYTISEADAAAIETELSAFDSNAENSGFKNGDAYAKMVFGKGVNKATVKRLMERTILANNYAADVFDGFTYDSAALDAYYSENADTLDTYSYSIYLVEAETEEVAEEGAEPEDKVTEATMAAAKTKAEEIAKAVKGGADFAEAVADAGLEGEPSECRDFAAYSVSSVISSWIKDSARSAGDVEVIESPESGWYVVRFESRGNNNYKLRGAHYMSLAAADEDGDGAYSEEEMNSARIVLETIKRQWESGEATAESFEALMNSTVGSSNQNINGGTAENLYVGQISEGFSDFVFDPARKVGDVGLVDAVNSVYLVCYTGEQEQTYHDYLAEYGNGYEVEGLRNRDYVEWQRDIADSNAVSTNDFVLWFAKTK